jgi:hypothetical protein
LRVSDLFRHLPAAVLKARFTGATKRRESSFAHEA